MKNVQESWTQEQRLIHYRSSALQALECQVGMWEAFRYEPSTSWIFFKYYQRADYAIRMLKDTAEKLRDLATESKLDEADLLYPEFQKLLAVGVSIESVITMSECFADEEGCLPQDINDAILEQLEKLKDAPEA